LTQSYAKSHQPTNAFFDTFAVISIGKPTACVTRWWAGRDNATLPESTSSHTNCLKTRRLPTSRVHAVLGALIERKTLSLQEDLTTNLTRLLCASLTNTPDKHHD